MNQTLNFTIPSWLELDELELLGVELLPNNEEQALVIIGDNLQAEKAHQPVVRLYLAEKVEEEFECIKELDAYVFTSAKHAIEFAESLPSLSALELLVALQNYR